MEFVLIACLLAWFFGARFWDAFKIFAAFAAAITLIYAFYFFFLYFSFKSLLDFLMSFF